MQLGRVYLIVACLGLVSCAAPSESFMYYPDLYPTPLHQAAGDSRPSILQARIAESRGVDARDKHGCTPLMYAASSSSPVNPNIRVLIEAGADVNARDEKGFTPLMYAVQSRWCHAHGSTRPSEDTLERVRILLDAGADLYARATNGQTVLMAAAGAGMDAALPDGAACSFLIEKGAEVEARDSEGLTALMHAARWSGENVPALLAAQADVNAVDNQGRTALMIAFTDAWSGGYSVEALLKAHPDLEVVDHKGWTVLAHAVWKGRTHYPTDRLLDAGARMEPLGWSALHAAAVRRDAERVKALLASHADPNARDKWGRTPIMWAARYIDNDRQTIPVLARAGGNVNAVDESGMSALHIAASHAWDGELHDLLACGAQIDARDTMGQTPLMCAVASRARRYQIEFLLKAGASINAVDNQGRTALIHAAMFEEARDENAPALIAAHADTQIRDASGRCAYDYGLNVTGRGGAMSYFPAR